MRRTLAPVADGDWFGLVVYQSLIQSLHRRSKLSREGAKRIQSNLNNTDSSLLWAVIFALNLKIDTISIDTSVMQTLGLVPFMSVLGSFDWVKNILRRNFG